VGLELGLLTKTEQLLERNVAVAVYKAENKAATLTTWHLLSAKLALTSPTSGNRLVGVVRLWTQATESPADSHHRVPFSFSPIWFSCTFLMPCPEAKLESSGDEVLRTRHAAVTQHGHAPVHHLHHFSAL
jgi:hypothetical protein